MTYDESVPDWPGEIEFYRGLASEVKRKGEGLQSDRIHCIFRLEMGHLLARASFCVEDAYGDFYRSPLGNDSPRMTWIAHKPQ